MNLFEILTKRACNQKLSAIIITHDDLAFGSNSLPEASSPVFSIRASSSISGHCGAAELLCPKDYQGISTVREHGIGNEHPSDCL